MRVQSWLWGGASQLLGFQSRCQQFVVARIANHARSVNDGVFELAAFQLTPSWLKAGGPGCRSSDKRHSEPLGRNFVTCHDIMPTLVALDTYLGAREILHTYILLVLRSWMVQYLAARGHVCG